MHNTIVIKIESGVVADVYSAAPLQVVVVDYDMIEGGETIERKMQKAVLQVTPEHRTNPESLDGFVKALVLECRRPADERAALGDQDQSRAA